MDPERNDATQDGIAANEDGAATQDSEQESSGGRSWRIIVLAIVVIAVLLSIGLLLSRNVRRPAEDVASGWPRNIEENVAGEWIAENSPVVIVFSPDGTYQVLNYQGRTIIGDWTVNDDGLIEVPVAYREYKGVWYFEPAGKDTLTVEVVELEFSDTFHKTD